MDAVVPGQAGDPIHANIGAAGNAVRPVAGVLRRVAGKDQAAAIDGRDPMRSAVVLLALRVVAVPAVDGGARFPDDGHIVGAIQADEGVIPPAPLCFEEREGWVVIYAAPGGVADLGRINGLHGVLLKDKVCLRVAASL